MKTRLVLLVWLFSFFTLGAVRSRAAAPTPITGTVDGITPAQATLHGTVNPNNQDTLAWFQYRLSFHAGYDGQTAPQALGSGTSTTPATAVVSSLLPRHNYYFQLVASNAAGISYGLESSFQAALLAMTLPATNITLTNAVLQGLLNPSGLNTRYFFVRDGYVVSPLLSTNSTNLVMVQFLLSGLQPQTTYSYGFVGDYGYVSDADVLVQFTTLSLAAAETQPATSVTANSAILNGTAYPTGATLNVFFEWGGTTNYGNVTSLQTATGLVAVAFQRQLNNLALGTYHFRLVATNVFLKSYGNDFVFTISPQPPPTVTTLAPTNLTITAATLVASVNPNGAATFAYFEWGVTTNYGSTTATQSLGAGLIALATQAGLTGLSPSTTYHFRAVATNSAGLALGADATFITLSLPPPAVTTLAPTNIGTNSATLNGSANPNNLATTTAFEWGLTTNYGNTTPSVALAAGTNAVVTQASLGGLVPGTAYHSRAVATNSTGAGLGMDATFTTLGLPPPAVTTLTPTSITTNSATLNGTANPNGLATTAWFQWGLTTNYGNTTAAQSLGAGGAAVAVSANLSALLTDTNYHCRLVASNSAGVTYGSNVIVTPTLFLYLFPGESWTYAFHDLPFYGYYFQSDRPKATASFSILPGSFADGSVVRMELLANAGGAPSYLLDVKSPAGGFLSLPFTPLWTDLEGAVRFTARTGSVVITSLFVEQIGTATGGLVPGYHNTITPTRNPPPPALLAQSISSVGLSNAAVQATVSAYNQTTAVFVQWGTTTNYGNASGADSVNFDFPVARIINVSNLSVNTAYHLRTVLTNTAGTIYGADLSFTTPVPATITTLPASSLRATSAVLSATVFATWLNTSNFFEWGATTNYGQVTSLQSLGIPNGQTNVARVLAGLSLQTAYHARGVVVSAGITNRGADVAFTTPPPPANTLITNLATDDVRGAMERGGLVTFACDGVLTLGSQVEIASDTCLDASGHAITISGGNATRLFQVPAGVNFTLTNVTLANGRATNAGGAIYNEGTVLAYNCRFLSNAVFGAAGLTGTNGLAGTDSPVTGQTTPGTKGGPAGNGQPAQGGAIYSSGSLNLAQCWFANNQATGGAGGQGGQGGRGGNVTCCGSNSGSLGGDGGESGAGGDSTGGSIANFGVLSVNSCTFSNSLTVGGRGGASGNGGGGHSSGLNGFGGLAGLGALARGGAVFSISGNTILDSFFLGNAVRGGTGGQGVGTSGDSVERRTSGTNGGLAAGGAIYMDLNGNLVRSTLLGNSVTGGDGGLAGWQKRNGHGANAFGGAAAVGTNCVIVNCTIVGNVATGGSGGTIDIVPFVFTTSGGNGGNAFGGGMAGLANCAATNLTLSGNIVVPGFAVTNGTYAAQNGIYGSTYGGSIANTGGVFQIVNSILSGGTSNNTYGVITDLGHNLSSDATPAWTSGTSLNNTDALLLPLANNGGPTLTMALKVGSPALNTADCASAPATDQRGYPRPSGPGCDIGAWEGAAQPTLLIARESAGTNVVRHAGEPGRAYVLQKTVNFSAWTPAMTNVAPAGGVVEFHVPVSGSPCFYRVVPQ